MPEFKLHAPSNRELNGGDLLAQSLRHLGVEVAFGLHGGHLDAFLLAAEETGIKLIDTRHETVAVQAAEGYAKISGKVGVCFVTANSGYASHHRRCSTGIDDDSASPMVYQGFCLPLRIDHQFSALRLRPHCKMQRRTRYKASTISPSSPSL
jgi:hypothetical protein